MYRVLRLADQHFVRDRTHRADFTFGARQHLAAAGNLQPLADVAVLADARPHLGGGLVDIDLERDRGVGRILDDDVRVWRAAAGWRRRLRKSRGGQAHHQRRNKDPGQSSPHQFLRAKLRSDLLFASRAGARAPFDEERGDALELQCASGIERGTAVAVRGVEVDALIGREPDALEHQRLALGAIRLHPRDTAAHARRGHHRVGDLGARLDRFLVVIVDRGARTPRWRRASASRRMTSGSLNRAASQNGVAPTSSGAKLIVVATIGASASRS